MTLLLGVDGGNSKAIALVARPDGAVVGAARRPGSADPYAAGDVPAMALVGGVVDDALAQAGSNRAEIGHAVFSMAGADWPEDHVLIGASAAAGGYAGPVLVVNDAIGALSGAVPEGPAVVVAIGSGAATGARAHDGATWHSSFWQSPQGAGELAHRTLAAVVRSELGIGPPTSLRAGLLAVTGDDDVEAVLHRFTARHAGPLPVGLIVRALLEEATNGDAVARDVVRIHGAGLGAVAAAAARRVGIARLPFALSFCGGLVGAGSGHLTDAAIEAIRGDDQAPTVVAPRWEPAVGAVVLALKADRPGALPDAAATRLDRTLPPRSFFDPFRA
ncbi:MAG: hypothetical protein LC798_04980 [Chloroflexi bacterium]|nr:hypothetical protein [Chloroflexota bacterium]